MTPDGWAEQWPMWLFAAGVAIAIAAAVWVATRRLEPRASLPLEHVAGAALVGLFGWEALAYLPGTVAQFGTLVAGIGSFDGVRAQQAFMVAMAAFVVAAALAVWGVLRRRTWAVVLGIGLSAVRAITSMASLVQLWIMTEGAVTVPGDLGYFGYAAPTIALQVVPPLVAVGLLAWPLLRSSSRADRSGADRLDPDWPVQPAPADQAR